MPYSDPEQRRNYHRDYKRRNRHRYAKRDSAYSAMVHANKRARTYGAPGRITIEEVLEIKKDPCHYCGKFGKWMGIDHVKPLHEGGLNRPENIVSSCHSCNASKYRQDRPGRWSRHHERCVQCRTTERKHIAHGRCVLCHNRWYNTTQRKPRTA